MESERKLGGQRTPTVVGGPLAGYPAGFRQALIDRGYARRTIGDQMSMMAHLSRWPGRLTGCWPARAAGTR